MAKSKTKYRAAIIGGGSIGGAHVQGYTKTASIELVACADNDPEKGNAFAARHGIHKVYTDYRQMLDRERPDICR